jgi:hypothetical protein
MGKQGYCFILTITLSVGLILSELHFYSDTLAATDKLLSEKPGLVTVFLPATLGGRREAIEDYRQAATVNPLITGKSRLESFRP